MTTLAEIRNAAMQLGEEDWQRLAWDLVDSVQKASGYDDALGLGDCQANQGH